MIDKTFDVLAWLVFNFQFIPLLVVLVACFPKSKKLFKRIMAKIFPALNESEKGNIGGDFELYVDRTYVIGGIPVWTIRFKSRYSCYSIKQVFDNTVSPSSVSVKSVTHLFASSEEAINYAKKFDSLEKCVAHNQSVKLEVEKLKEEYNTKYPTRFNIYPKDNE